MGAGATCPPHWWIIKPNYGVESDGTCKKCGETRVFANFLNLNMRVPYTYQHNRLSEDDKKARQAVKDLWKRVL